ncbi:adenylosuccinate synthase [Stackebrandtia albiflava]|uniref:Adenylosuccinate synthetase n=1 Tax=Stackebrandtia albiflava TaxID=406432 RepID=A0A562VA55_9ACTN|nr:adenylosuccinate synthetase [Stackebrandtia albiflava]TWJ14733.1 adenylosuccinate synthase [Stackebrandtia albiflava]
MNGDSHVIVVDLGFGDAGKGTVVDWLCAMRGHRTVIRYNGGAQAAHNVVTPDGTHHTFAQFGAGSLVPGVHTHLSDRMLVDPLALATEADHLASCGVADPWRRLTVDERALITTPWHRAANRARELARGRDRHGSCGMGIGETARYALRYPQDAPTVGDCRAPARLRRKLAALAGRLPHDPATPVPEVDRVAAVLADFAATVRIVDGSHVSGLLADGPAVFEGAQGVLLDEWHGFHPYTTWSTTTTANASAILAESGGGATAFRLGVLRAYTTRHGPGPLVTEDPELSTRLPEPHNSTGRWQGAFRAGHFDAVAHRYALAVTGGVDALAVTHLDTVADSPVRMCDTYRMPDGSTLTDLVPGDRDLERQRRLTARLSTARPVLRDPLSGDRAAEVSAALGVPVALTSHGPGRLAKRVVSTVTAPADSATGTVPV